MPPRGPERPPPEAPTTPHEASARMQHSLVPLKKNVGHILASRAGVIQCGPLFDRSPPKWPRDGLRGSQGWPKTAPRCPGGVKRPSRCLQEAPKRLTRGRDQPPK
eukprot:7248487-Pyramimonas_sp.AAC.1